MRAQGPCGKRRGTMVKRNPTRKNFVGEKGGRLLDERGKAKKKKKKKLGDYEGNNAARGRENEGDPSRGGGKKKRCRKGIRTGGETSFCWEKKNTGCFMGRGPSV